jgi:hypothetical protein
VSSRRSTAEPSRDRYDPHHASSIEPSNALLKRENTSATGH